MGRIYRVSAAAGLLVLTGGCTHDIPWGGPAGSTTLLFANFESSSQSFEVIDNANSSWEWGEPTSGPNAATSGRNVWATDLNGDYNDDEDSCLQTPVIDAPPDQEIHLSYELAVETEEDFDYWSVFLTDASGTQVDDGHGGNASSYQQQSADVSDAAGSEFRVRWCLETDGNYTMDGLYLDDVHIYALP